MKKLLKPKPYPQLKSILLMAIACLCACPAHPSAYAGDKRINALRTFGTMGKELRPLSKTEEAVLFSYEGKGCLTHMWFGGAFKAYGETRIRVYVDNEKEASIDMELLLGHGIGFNNASAPWGTERMGNTGGDSGIYRIKKGTYANLLAGLTHLDKEENEFSAYRLHEDDPVFFQNGLRLTNRCGEKIGDKVFHDPPKTRYTTYVWLYQW